MTLPIGSKAPDAAGILPDGSRFTIAGLRGRPVVLYFYPRDFTPTCTAEACQLRDVHQDMVGIHDAQVVGVSRDSPERHARFIREHRLPFPLVTDSTGEIAKAYEAAYLGGLIPLPVVKRITYVIDAEGIIRGALHDERHADRHVEFVQRCLNELRKS
jgi:peroxiredoxin Q/BCP